MMNATLLTIVLAVAATQWLGSVLFSALSRKPLPKRGWRSSEKLLVGSSAAFLAVALLVFDVRALLWRGSNATQAAMASRRTAGSCSALTVGMSAADVTKRLGKADEVRKDEETRGPDAAIWIYRDSRCAVHLFEGAVEAIE
jgi:hypothetical protein